MAYISIHNNSYDIEGNVSYTDSYAAFEVALDIYINMDDGGREREVCWFEQKGVHLSFHDWQGNDDILNKFGWFYIGGKWDNMFYTKVCGKEAIPNQDMLERYLNDAVNRYRKAIRMIHSH